MNSSSDALLMARRSNQKPGSAWAAGDFNYDGIVGMADADLLRDSGNASANAAVG